MTLDRYKFLGALSVFSADNFTVEDIVRFTKIPKATVATFLNRETRYVERIGSIPTGRRGGQIAQYRVRPESKRMLENEANQLPTARVANTTKVIDDDMVPSSVIVAEDTISRLLPKASGADRYRTIDVAKFLISNAEYEVRKLQKGRNSGLLQQRITTLKEQLSQYEPTIDDRTSAEDDVIRKNEAPVPA